MPRVATPVDENRSQAMGIALIAFVLAFTLYFIAKLATAYMAIASLNFFLLSAGLIYRKEKLIHAPLMSIAIFSDIALVLVLQVQRQAVQTAASMELPLLSQMHIASSLFAVLLYIPVFALGVIRFRATRPNEKHRQWHIRLGFVAYALRAAGFVLMFSMLQGQ